MNTESWIIATDTGRVGGMLAVARRLGGNVAAVVVGPRDLADAVAATDVDKVLWFAVAADAPVESCAEQVAEAAVAAAPQVVLSSDAPSGRVLLGKTAAKLGAAVVGSVRGLDVEGDNIVVRRSAADGRVVETLEVACPLACVFDGEDDEQVSDTPAPVEEMTPPAPDDFLRVVETQAAADSAGLRTAAHVVGVGLGVVSKDDIAMVRKLADSLHAEVACTLPVCDDMRWFEADRVLGSSHNQIAPDLYLALGISGQPQHLSGVRDAKVVVAVNNDSEARIFKNCNYGILGDLYKVVPALTKAFENVGV